ncbi:LysM domain-containing protein [Paraoerskovia marina]|uniref:LysM domain-containing protein n=1 Tax=Paraoerskovia marina TaxID=545619 RepID=A0A1H1TT19_9CELL|nr:LysM peptidoglycan-binding domain-containing protein [Paraoerskovia marina]SDS63475.1 LysM domain-containing protein [Paraoerskovia marina]
MTTLTLAPAGHRHTAGSLSSLRLTRRGRVVLAVLAATVGFVVSLLGARAVVADAPAAPVEVREVVVEPGDTLWSYASEMTVVGADVRDVLADIVELNGLQTSTLEIGQTVLLPVTSE